MSMREDDQHQVAVDAALGPVRVTNEYDFVTLAHLQPTWVVEVDGLAIAEGTLDPVDAGPGASTDLRSPVPRPDLRAGERACLTVAFALAADQPWAPAGHVVASSRCRK